MKYKMTITNIDLSEIKGFLNTPLIHAIYKTLKLTQSPDNDNEILLSKSSDSRITLEPQEGDTCE